MIVGSLSSTKSVTLIDGWWRFWLFVKREMRPRAKKMMVIRGLTCRGSRMMERGGGGFFLLFFDHIQVLRVCGE